MTNKSLFLFLFTLLSLHLVGQKAPILTEKPVKGAYKSANEFLNNAPSILDSLTYHLEVRKGDMWDTTYSVVPSYAITNTLVRDVWGFSDGENIFVYHQSEFFRININNEGKIDFFAYPHAEGGGGEALSFIGGFVGGLFGATIASESSNAQTHKKWRRNKAIGAMIGGGLLGGLFGGIGALSKYNSVKKRMWNYHIHPVTGVIQTMPIVKNDINMDAASLPSHSKVNIILYRLNYRERDTKVEIKINGKVVASQGPDSYDKIPLTLSNEPVEICVNGNVTCIQLDVSKPRKIYCAIKFRLKSEPIIYQVIEKNGVEFSERALRFQNKRENEN